MGRTGLKDQLSDEPLSGTDAGGSHSGKKPKGSGLNTKNATPLVKNSLPLWPDLKELPGTEVHKGRHRTVVVDCVEGFCAIGHTACI